MRHSRPAGRRGLGLAPSPSSRPGLPTSPPPSLGPRAGHPPFFRQPCRGGKPRPRAFLPVGCPPKKAPGHRIVLIRTNDKDTYALDAWWPGGKVEKLNQNDNYDKCLSYPKLKFVAFWENKDNDFVEALRDELEISYEKVKGEFSLEDAGGRDLLDDQGIILIASLRP